MLFVCLLVVFFIQKYNEDTVIEIGEAISVEYVFKREENKKKKKEKKRCRLKASLLWLTLRECARFHHHHQVHIYQAKGYRRKGEQTL